MARVVSVKPYGGPVNERGLVPVYDLTAKHTHRYYVFGLLVSNSKRNSLLDMNALLSHGAMATLDDAGSVRGQRNEDYWMQFLQGNTPRKPRVPFAYEKFVHQLQAAGINVVRQGTNVNVMALTNKDVKLLAGDRFIGRGDTVRFDHDMTPISGGLFDPKLTGGHGGKRWSAIKLSEPMPNPVMEEPIRRILGLTQQKFEDVLGGREQLDGLGSGPAAIGKALDRIDLAKELEQTRAQVKAGRATVRDQAVRKLGYLKSADKLGLHPRDWMLDSVPVLPPAFRPVSLMGNGVPLVSDPNYLYKELLDADDNLKSMKDVVGDDETGPERLAVYHAFKAVTGLGEPVHPKLKEKNVKGMLASIFGSSPKFGTVQRKLLSNTVDNVGRAVVIPNPDYDMDTIGIPESKAFDVYQKFIVRRLRRRGLPILQGLKHVREQTSLAREALMDEMKKRPVYVNRAPVLHRWGIMAFRPKLVKGSVVQVSPLIVKGFNMDFDGDAVQFHVPTKKEAVDEAYDRMLPSKNLISIGDFKTPWHVPGQEYLGGLYHATTTKSKRTRARHFASVADAKKAYERGEIELGEEVVILS